MLGGVTTNLWGACERTFQVRQRMFEARGHAFEVRRVTSNLRDWVVSESLCLGEPPVALNFPADGMLKSAELNVEPPVALRNKDYCRKRDEFVAKVLLTPPAHLIDSVSLLFG